MIVRLAALLLLAALAGCSTSSNKLGKDAAKLLEFKQTAKFDVRWRADIGDAGNNILQPALMPDAVYAANAKGKLFKLQRASGKRLWRANSGFTISAAVGAGNGLVLIGGAKGELAAFGEDGKLRWQTTVSSEVLNAPQIADGVVVVRTGDGRINGLDAADGKRLWLYERAMPSLIVRSHAGVTIDRGTVYAGFAAGKLAAISLTTGVVLWETVVSQPRGNTELERISDIISAPVADGERVCAVAFQGRVACFSQAQGGLLWSRDLSSDKGMSQSGNNLYVTADNGALWALDKNSGSSMWKNDQMTLRRITAPLVLGRYLLVGEHEGYLHALSLEDGALVARFKAGDSPVVSAPLEMDGGLLVQAKDGGLYSVALH